MTHKIINAPSVPESLILPLDDILKLENIFGGATKNYTTHEVPDDLREYLQSIFPDCTKFRYQTMRGEIPVHKDRGRVRAINYILDTGGDNARTVWYEEDYTTPTHSMKLEERKWHEIDVGIYHNVINIDTVRYAITVA